MILPEEGVPLTWTTLSSSRILANVSTVLVRGLIAGYLEAINFFGRWAAGDDGTVNKHQ